MEVVYSLQNMFLRNKLETAAVVTNFIVLEFLNFTQEKKYLKVIYSLQYMFLAKF